MLDLTLGETYEPGSNRRGDAAGAPWSLLLPHLEIRTAVCIGKPPVPTARMLQRLADEVLVLEPPADTDRQAALATRLAAADATVDLVDVGHRWGSGDRRRHQELAAALAPHLSPAAVVHEPTSAGRRAPWAAALGVAGASLELWCTPALGQPETIVPTADLDTARWLRRVGLTVPVLTEDRLVRWRAAYRARRHPLPEDVPPSPRSVAGGGRQAGTARKLLRAAAAVERFATWRVPALRQRRLLTGADIGPAMPAYVRSLARDAGIDLGGHRWALVAPSAYDTQKVLLFAIPPGGGDPAYVVKIGRGPMASARLERAAAGLRTLQSWPDLLDGTVPTVAFAGRERGLAIVAETAVTGTPFRAASDGTATCPYAAAAVDWLTRLGQTSAEAVPAGEAAGALLAVTERLAADGLVDRDDRAFLEAQAAALAEGGPSVPSVFQHGDPGTWNLLARPEAAVGILDWENADPAGVAASDLFYFLRSYAVLADQRARPGRRPDPAGSFLTDTAVRPFLERSVDTYRAALALGAPVVEASFYACWAVQAMKEAARRQAGATAPGAYLRFLQQMIAERENPALLRLLHGR